MMFVHMARLLTHGTQQMLENELVLVTDAGEELREGRVAHCIVIVRR